MFGLGRRLQLKEMEPEQVHRAMQAGEVHLVDVREQQEWKARRVPGAILAPLSILHAVAADLPHDRPLVLYCQSGARSAQAISVLSRLGYPCDTHMKGGILAWMRSGLPVEA